MNDEYFTNQDYPESPLPKIEPEPKHEFWKWFTFGMCAQFGLWIPMCCLGGPWFHFFLYLPFFMVTWGLREFFQLDEPSALLELFLPIGVGSICYSAIFALFARVLPARRPASSRLQQVYQTTQDLKIDDSSEEGFYEGVPDKELVGVYSAIDKIRYPERFAALILEIRKRVESSGKR